MDTFRSEYEAGKEESCSTTDFVKVHTIQRRALRIMWAWVTFLNVSGDEVPHTVNTLYSYGQFLDMHGTT